MAVERRGWAIQFRLGQLMQSGGTPRIWTRARVFMDSKSRMSREAHVRFRERPEMKLPRPTRLHIRTARELFLTVKATEGSPLRSERGGD